LPDPVFPTALECGIYGHASISELGLKYYAFLRSGHCSSVIYPQINKEQNQMVETTVEYGY